jgi:exo-1,4-beta-D-glucosaminidase
MIKTADYLRLVCLLIYSIILLKCSANKPQEKKILLLSDNWQLKSSFLIKEDGGEISALNYKPEQWYKTTVPATVLTALVKNGVYPDPRNGLDCYRIPDASDEFNKKNDLEKFSYLPRKRNPWSDPYWYRTEFKMPKLDAALHYRLNFNCINYRAEVWLNGKLIADKNKMAGMFQRFRYDVSKFIREGKNVLAVKIFPLDYPGMPDKQLEVFGKLRRFGGEIYRNVTESMILGYDCMMTVPDRNIGICQKVYIDWSAAVDIRNPFIITDLPLPDTSRAELKISAELSNNSSSAIKGILRGTIPQAGMEFSQAVDLKAHETKLIRFDENPLMENPCLWWPLNYGKQYLYDLYLQFETKGTVSDVKKITFGVREISTEMHTLGNWHGRRIMINGRKIFCRGGYIQPELLLDWGKNRIRDELQYYADANMNLIYFEDIPNPPDKFLNICDSLGILFGNDFYGASWVNIGTNYPDDFNLLETCTIDLLKRYRNHPSLIMYMALNEHTPREKVYVMWRKYVKELDGTRFWIPSGHFADNRKDVPDWIKADLPTGMNDYGGTSYRWKEPVTYFKWVREDSSWMFKMEGGSASLPPISSLAKFIPDLGKRYEGIPFPLSETWAHHGANGFYANSDAALRRLHGEPQSVADYCWKAHLITADQHRSFYEAVNHRMWTITSGFTEWKINSAFPDVQWQNFDYYLKPGISHFYIKKACEPLHIQLNLIDKMVSIINTHLSARENLKVSARIFDLNAKLLWEQEAAVNVKANSYKETFIIPEPLDASPVYFVKLELKDKQGNLVSENFYWLRNKKTGDYKSLQALPPVKLKKEYTIRNMENKKALRVKISNPSEQIAFFVQLAVVDSEGNEILPVIWDTNYFSLLPGESKTIDGKFSIKKSNNKFHLQIGGWNIRTPYKCTKLQASAVTLTKDDTLKLTAVISNTFLDGSRVWLEIDGKPQLAKWAWAIKEKSDTLIFKSRFSEAGKHQLRIGERLIELNVK